MRLQALKTPNWGGILKDKLKDGGYNVIGQVLQEAEQKGIFHRKLEDMSVRHKRGKVRLNKLMQRHEEQYPHFQTFDQYNHDHRVVFMSDKTLKSGRRKGVSFRLTNSDEHTGSMEIRFGTARVIQNEEGTETLENFIETPMPKLPSTGKDVIYGYHDLPYEQLFDTMLGIRQQYNEELKI